MVARCLARRRIPGGPVVSPVVPQCLEHVRILSRGHRPESEHCGPLLTTGPTRERNNGQHVSRVRLTFKAPERTHRNVGGCRHCMAGQAFELRILGYVERTGEPAFDVLGEDFGEGDIEA